MGTTHSSSKSKDGKLCVDKFGVVPYPLGYGEKEENKTCKQRDFCVAQPALQAVTKPGFSEGGCS